MDNGSPRLTFLAVFCVLLAMCQPAWAYGYGPILRPLAIVFVLLVVVPILAVIDNAFINAKLPPEQGEKSFMAVSYGVNALILLAIYCGVKMLGSVMVSSGAWSFSTSRETAWVLLIVQYLAIFAVVLAIRLFLLKEGVGLPLTGGTVIGAAMITMIAFGLFAASGLRSLTLDWHAVPKVRPDELRTGVDAEIFFIRGRLGEQRAMGLNLRTGEERIVGTFGAYSILHVDEVVPGQEARCLQYWNSGEGITLSEEPEAGYFLVANTPGPGCDTGHSPALKLPLGRIRQPASYDARKPQDLGFAFVWMNHFSGFIDYRREEDMDFFIGTASGDSVKTLWRDTERRPDEFAMITPFVRYDFNILAVFSDGKALLGVSVPEISSGMTLFLYDPVRGRVAQITDGSVDRIIPLEFEPISSVARVVPDPGENRP